MDSSKLDPSKHYLLSGATLAALTKEQKFLRRGGHIQRGPGIRIRTAGQAGLAISASATSTPVPVSGSSAKPLPFAVNIINKGDGVYNAWVNLNSTLFLNPFFPDQRQVITGLGKSAAFNLNGNDLIWLELSFINTSGLSLTGATIKSYGMGNAWDVDATPAVGVHGYYEFTTTTDGSGNTIQQQTLARIRIAQTIAGTGGAPVLNQLLFQNLLYEFYTGLDGTPLGWASPWGQGLYTDTDDT
jgi:hypothetical protein